MHKNIPCLQIGSEGKCHGGNSFPSACTAGQHPRPYREIKGFQETASSHSADPADTVVLGVRMQHDWLAGNSLGAQLATCRMLSCWHLVLTVRGIPSLES